MKSTYLTQDTFWSEYRHNGCDWLKALTEPWDFNRRRQYTHATMPVPDDSVPNGWREQSTVGTYIDYGRFGACRSPEQLAVQPGYVLAICYASESNRWVETIDDAKVWIETEALRIRPELTFQATLPF